jgi:transglutaminase-like putative cysteine protease
MQLTICHRTTYRYQRPVTLLPHRMMLCPRGQNDLRVMGSHLNCTPPAAVEWTQDVYGNLIATASFSEPSETLVIDSRIVIDQSAAAWPIFRIAPSAHDFPFTYDPEDIDALGSLLRPCHEDAGGELAGWLARFRADGPTDTLDLLKAINSAVWTDHGYEAREEEGTRTPAETLRAASGSCRDFAMLFIDAVRTFGFGARAVSGYVYDPLADEAGGPQHGSTHAWAEVYLPCAGWIAFDPTNGRVGNANLIPVAVARDIRRIPPVDGSYTGATQDFLDMSVAVTISARPDRQAA